MKISIVANYPNNLSGSSSKGRFMYVAEMLAERGHQVELITSDFLHDTKSHRKAGSVKQSAYKTHITVLQEPGYKKNVSLHRLYSHLVWGRNVGQYLAAMKNGPDVIYCAVPSLTACRKAMQYCKKHPKTSFVVDIQDVWPEAFAMVLPKAIHWLLTPIKWYVDSFYSQADAIVGVSNTYRDRGLSVNRCQAKGLTVYLGNNGELFDEGRKTFAIEREDNEIWLAYIGTLGYSYDIPCVLNALSIYKDNYPEGKPVRFVVMGGGPFRERWENEARHRGLLCDFTGPLPYQKMAGMLSSCDICVNPIVKGSAASIINKVGDYALSGLPVINTQENAEYRALVEEYHCGINCDCGNAEQVAEAIARLANNEEECKEMGTNARCLGVDRFDRRTSYWKIIELVESMQK